MVGTIVHQLTDGVCPEELEKAGLGAYYTDHGVDVYPQSAAGVPFTALPRSASAQFAACCNPCSRASIPPIQRA